METAEITRIKGELEECLKKPNPMIKVAGLLAYSEEETFPIDRKFLHGFMKNVRDKEEYRDFLEEFSFSEVDIYPFSRLFEEVINNLLLSGILKALNPAYKKLSMDKETMLDIRRLVEKRYSKEEEDLIKIRKLGEEFRRYAEANK